MKRLITTILSLAAVALLVFAVRHAMRSPLFVASIVEITDPAEGSPLDAQEISELAAVPVGKVNLFDLDIESMKQRLLTNSWIKSVTIQKRFPQTVAIDVGFRKPVALFQRSNGVVSYVDEDGSIFGRVNLMYQPDLPILSGFETSSDRMKQAIVALRAWSVSQAAKSGQIASLQWDPERGFRALVSYSVGTRKGRTMLDFGHELEPELDHQFDRVAQVLGYVSTRSIAVRQIWADSGKKIVVKLARQ